MTTHLLTVEEIERWRPHADLGNGAYKSVPAGTLRALCDMALATARRSPPGDEVEGLIGETAEAIWNHLRGNATEVGTDRKVVERHIRRALARQQAKIVKLNEDFKMVGRVMEARIKELIAERASERAAREKAEGLMRMGFHEKHAELYGRAEAAESRLAALEQDKQQADEKCARLVEANAWFNGQVDALRRTVEDARRHTRPVYAGGPDGSAEKRLCVIDMILAEAEALTAAQQEEPAMQHIQNATDGGSESNRPGAQDEGEAALDHPPVGYMPSRNRPATNPGGCECMTCGVIFIGEEWHTQCAACAEGDPQSSGHTAVTGGEEGCRCQGCDMRYKVDLMIPDNLWDQIKPPNKVHGAGLLCGRCIIGRLEAIGFNTFDLLPENTIAHSATLRPDPVLREVAEALDWYATVAETAYQRGCDSAALHDVLNSLSDDKGDRARSAHAKLKALLEGHGHG